MALSAMFISSSRLLLSSGNKAMPILAPIVALPAASDIGDLSASIILLAKPTAGKHALRSKVICGGGLPKPLVIRMAGQSDATIYFNGTLAGVELAKDTISIHLDSSTHCIQCNRNDSFIKQFNSTF